VFTARYALSPYIKQIRFVFKGLITTSNWALNLYTSSYICTALCSCRRAKSFGFWRFSDLGISDNLHMQDVLRSVIQHIVQLKCSLCGPNKAAFYAYAYTIYIRTQYVYNTALHTYINVCTYMHPHWKRLHPLCSWSGYGSARFGLHTPTSGQLSVCVEEILRKLEQLVS
jgi:hypothetical protein